MAKTASMAALLHVALQDLHAGKALLVGRLPALAEAASDAGLRAAIAAMREHAAAARDRLAALNAQGGPASLWMAGIADDADRDAGSHLPGRILDTALVGALRKACAAEIVSLDTALALAVAQAPGMVAPLDAIRTDTVADDRALHDLLGILTL